MTEEAMEEKSRKEKRKERKKMKRKLIRRDLAEKERLEEEKRLNDPLELKRLEDLEIQEMERMERDRREFQERERLWLQALQDKTKLEEEAQQLEEEASTTQIHVEKEDETKEDDEWEYVEEGPPEIIWQGNEIIVRKKKIRVPKKDVDRQNRVEDADRPTSNPLPPQSEAFAEYQNAALVSAQQVLENVAQQVPNFGTEQDKAHCPFHLKTGACRFGERCSRVHFYPDKACTLLIRNMYNGPGLVWEQDEGLEHTDEEVERCYEEFYEDVHTEFLKYGEIINFKVCKNSSPHLRGNVYVHYKSIDSAVLAFHSISGRYFAGKQVKCEFVNVTRWKVAICGEYMKSRLKSCSRGITCNFIHCFRNPGGDYEWADWDKPPPRFWVKKMAALFGYSGESAYDIELSEPDRHHAGRSRSRDIHKSSRSSDSEDNVQEYNSPRLRRSNGRKQSEIHDEKTHEGQRRTHRHHRRRRSHYDYSDRRWSGSDGDSETEEYRHRASARKRSGKHSAHWEEKLRPHTEDEASSPSKFGDDIARRVNTCASDERSYEHKSRHQSRKRSGSESIVSELIDNHLDRNRTFHTDSCDYHQLESGNSRDYNHGSKRLRHKEPDLSVNRGANDEKTQIREREVTNSHPRRERTDGRLRTRVHSSRSDEDNYVMQPNESHVYRHILKRRSESPDQNSLEGIDAQDRWQPESPDAF